MSDKDVRAFPLSEMRTHRSTKWRDFPSDVLPLPVAEMDFPVALPIRKVLIEMVEHSDLGYLGPIPEVGLAFADFAMKRWGWNVDPKQVHMVTDVGVGVVELLRLFTQPGDRVLINSPIYHNFYTWINETHVTKVDVPFTQANGSWDLDLGAVEAAYRTGIKVHLLCNPHNPLGRVYSREELLKIATLAKEHGVLVISDEIHAPLTYKEATFVPFLSLGEIAEEVGVTVTAASKGWNIAGLKCAMIITQGTAMSQRLEALPPAVHCRASLLGAFATATAFSEGTAWLDSMLVNLDANRHFLKELLATKIPAIGYQIPECSYLAWLDVSALGLGENPTQTLLERGKVAFNAGQTFSPHTSHFVRLNFATSQELLVEAVERILNAL